MDRLKRDYQCLKVDGEVRETSMHSVAEETPLSIFINGRHFVTAMISPYMVREFVIGYLFSERIVNGLQDVESLEIDENTARLMIADPIKALVPRKPIVSGCGGLASFLDESRLPKIASNLKITKHQIFSSIKAISSSELHASTGGVHSVGLFGKDGSARICEDIGRHNALDKAIGYCLGEGFDFGQIFAASTGRISSEMALKCSMAGIPIISSRGATTSLAISIAEETGLCIIGFVRGERMNIYTGRARIESC